MGQILCLVQIVRVESIGVEVGESRVTWVIEHMLDICRVILLVSYRTLLSCPCSAALTGVGLFNDGMKSTCCFIDIVY